MLLKTYSPKTVDSLVGFTLEIIISLLIFLFFLVLLDLGNRLAISGAVKISEVTGLVIR